MKFRFLFLSLSMMCAAAAMAQISGTVLSDEGDPLIGANVYWANTTRGTITDAEGEFKLESDRSTNLLVTSYMGYHNDTTQVSNHAPLTVILVSDLVLDEVTIAQRRAAVVKSRVTAFDTQTLGSDELCKAACCNLSEAFETSAAVDVAYSDAATGAKTIKMLGLSGTYVQLLTENTPGVRGLAQNFGMEYIPGPWMSSIQVSKGTSSVLNGYESTTGQINVEYLKPQTQDPVAINVMLNSELHAELNIEGGGQFKKLDPSRGSLYAGVLAHYQEGFMKMDDNGDHFLDMPLSRQLNIANRWHFKKDQYTFQAYVRGLYDKRTGGQVAQYKNVDSNGEKTLVKVDDPYQIDLRTHRVDGFIKNGYVFDEETGMSIGIQAAGSYHDQQNRYGRREWNASQANAYLNAIFQTNFEGSERLGMDNDHRLSAGVSLNFDKYNELLSLPSTDDVLGDTTRYDLSRMEFVPGVFAEYSLKLDEILSLVAGIRGDWSSRYGFFVTPRLNVRYSPWEWWNIRASVGLGYRSPNVIADNSFMMPSSREIRFSTPIDSLALERAVNAGVSTTFYIPIGTRELQLSAEYYYTGFLNSVIADMDQATDRVVIYNQSAINGRSFAHNAQIEASMEICRGWTMTGAFRYTDVEQTTYNATLGAYQLREKPLSKKFKGVISTSYQTPLKKWQFDFTAQFNGGGRMPDGFNEYYLTTLNSRQYTEGKDGSLYYKWYPQLLAQITKYFRTCSIYLGAENMTNFKQDSPILGAEEPYNQGFDASMAWGPITGWKLYGGFRWALGKED